MALIICPKCNQNYSDKARSCPHCGYKKKTILPYVLVALTILIVVIFTSGYFVRQRVNEQKIVKQEKIQNYIDQIDTAYTEARFDDIDKNIQALDNLGYDTTELKVVLEYDRSVYDDAVKYYTTMKRVCENVRKGEYTSLKDEYYELKKVTETFDGLEVNSKSRIGAWISNYRNSGDYIAWKAFITGDYIDSIEITSFTEFLPVSMLETVAGPLLKKEFPIAIKEGV
ncbi:zinc ribbon domain-containing protein [Butyrivibrio sp. XBB1001]|uniref:zinc ribbon domain-containing protein n=1 Tax=Butyrivibrio sp. XBB1001 TaxID=1280682 RepID=UPI0004033F03|nr:zinc ribbon domain-containing protein [Butyrivibrio sp. XBB1001]